MKLLVCTYEFPPSYSSGAGNVAYYAVNELGRMGVDCIVCSPTGGDIQLCSRSLIEKAYDHGIFYHLYKILYFWYKASKYVRQNHSEYDVVWLHNPSPVAFRTRLKKSLVTIQTTYYGYSLTDYPMMVHLYHKIMARWEKHAYKNISGMFTGVSQQVCHELEELGVGHERVTYIPNGVDTARFKPSEDKRRLRKKFNLPENSIIVLSLGRLKEPKQPYKLIEVFSSIGKNIEDVTLVIAGDGELLDKTKGLAKQRGLKKVRFLGYVDHVEDAPGLYACADYYIMTSKSEGQPLTLLEAMSSGLPCIVSDIPALSSIVQNAECGIVIDFNNEEKAAERITSYIKEKPSGHSRNARKYAVSNLDWEIIAKRYWEEFEKLK